MANPPRHPPRTLADPGAMLGSTHELADGSRVRLRLTRPSDLRKIEAFLEALSPRPARAASWSPRPGAETT